MRPEQLAHEFFLGIRTALTCPEVSVAEYEGVIASKIEHAIETARAEQREADATIAGGWIGDIIRKGCSNAS